MAYCVGHNNIFEPKFFSQYQRLSERSSCLWLQEVFGFKFERVALIKHETRMAQNGTDGNISMKVKVLIVHNFFWIQGQPCSVPGAWKVLMLLRVKNIGLAIVLDILIFTTQKRSFIGDWGLGIGDKGKFTIYTRSTPILSLLPKMSQFTRFSQVN